MRALPELLQQHLQFESFCDSLSKDLVAEWTQMVEEWEADHDKLNPSESKTLGMFVYDYILMEC